MSRRRTSFRHDDNRGTEMFTSATVARPLHNIATRIVDGLTLPDRTAELIPADALPLPDLIDRVDDLMVRYAVVRIDRSGRIKNKPIAQMLTWLPGERLDISMINDCLALRPASDGPLTMGRDHDLLLPAAVRHRCRVTPGEHLLLAAFPTHRLLLAHTPAALHRMLTLYHAPPQQQPDLPGSMTPPIP